MSIPRVFSTPYCRRVAEFRQVLSISQPTVSYCHKRLRTSFDDPLFEICQNRFIATAKAQRIAPYLQNILDAVNFCAELDNPAPIQPAQQPIQLYLQEYFELLLLPDLLERVLDSRIAPGINLQHFLTELPIG
ncbi:LysR family transcriptional regulator [Chitinimonas sp. BJB300]|uniref:LysR family transcriptional regulator n=1 Tax=Chitinimonas sp. BJB300 TaxID=1559339 RepID=UPI001112B468|nr:LysR family transcriptional regulator [Chitinimonas sp. BJB300]TSJ88053.1 LysR family transcriptional regulator [Chitinimonas sp. BJB300]